MSDDPAAASFLDRVNTLSAPAVVGLGAAMGFLLAVLSALRVEPSPTLDLEPATAGAGVVQDSSTAPKEDAPVGGAGASRAAAGGGQAEPGVAAQDSARQEADPRGDAPIPEDDPADLVLLEPDVGAPDDEANPDASVDAPADAPADASAQDSTAPDPPPSSTGRTQADRDAEAKMDADELLAAAADAYKEKRYKDAYRLATRSQRSRPGDKAQMLRGRCACRLRDRKNAREIVRSFKLGDEHRKTLRTFCKDRGVRVGL